MLQKSQHKVKMDSKGLLEKGIDLKTKKTLVKIRPKYFRPSEVNYLKEIIQKQKETKLVSKK